MYKNINIDYDKKKVLFILNARLKIMPNGINNLFAIIGQYLNKQFETQEFIKNYLKMAPVLFLRIEKGVNCEEFKKNYTPEIKMLKKIMISCNDFNQQKISKETFDLSIEIETEEYSKTKIERKTHFSY